MTIPYNAEQHPCDFCGKTVNIMKPQHRQDVSSAKQKPRIICRTCFF